MEPGLPARKAREPRRISKAFRDRESLELLAAQVRQAYIAERSDRETIITGRRKVWKPGHEDDIVSSSGRILKRGLKSVWLKIARICREIGADPATYVRVQFELCSDRNSPSPSQLATPSAKIRYESAWPGLRSEIRRSLSQQVEVASQQVRCLQALGVGDSLTASLMVIGDLTVPLSPLFRYCFACSLGERANSLRQKLLPGAIAQYVRCPVLYDEEWRQVLPPDFKEEVSRFQSE